MPPAGVAVARCSLTTWSACGLCTQQSFLSLALRTAAPPLPSPSPLPACQLFFNYMYNDEQRSKDDFLVKRAINVEWMKDSRFAGKVLLPTSVKAKAKGGVKRLKSGPAPHPDADGGGSTADVL